MGSEPRGCEPDALERVPGIDVPCYALFAPDIASAWPADFFAAALEFRREGCGRDGRAGWVGAMVGFEVRGNEFDSQAGICVLEGCFQAEFEGFQGGVVVDYGEVDGFFLCALEEDFLGGGGLGDRICRYTGFHDSGFVPGDFFNGVTEELRVVNAEASDTGDAGRNDDVRAVVFTSNATFDDRRIDAFADVGMEGHQGEEAKVGRFGGFVGWFSS